MLNTAIKAARNASKIILQFVDRLDSVEISEKKHNDIVTQVDKLAEEEIVHTLRDAYPDHSILAEESGFDEKNEFCWIIDPLDGTTNFVHGFPQYAISIALKHKDDLTVGVVYDPIRNEMFTASKGQGAFLNNRRIRVSQAKKLESALIGTGFPFKSKHHLKPYLATFEALFPQTGGIRRAGAAALDLAYVAAGRLDGFWEAALQPWDMAAGVLMIKEAGGMVSDFHGEDTYLDSGNLIAGNTKVFKEVLAIVNESLQQW